MPDISVSYKGSSIATIDSTRTTVLETSGKYCEDDITIDYVKPGGITPTGTKQISVVENGISTEDITNYANVEVTTSINDSSLVLLPLVSSYKNLFNGKSFAGGLRLDFANVSSFSGKTDIRAMMNNLAGVTSVTIANLSTNETDLLASSFLWGCSAKTVTFENCDFSPQNFDYAFRQMSNLEEIVGALDFTNTTSASTFFYSDSKLEEVRFKPSTISISLSFSGNIPFSNESLVSIANGLVAGVTGGELTISATNKSKCTAIIGINDNGSFVVNSGGSLSLTDFITTVKGWTLP